MIKNSLMAAALVIGMTAGAASALADNQKPISWAELQALCANPKGGKDGVQVSPEHIFIQCTDTSTQWVADAPGSLPLDGKRTVTPGVISDKFVVSEPSKEYPVVGKGFSCLKYKEIRKTATVEKALSCAEIVGVKGDLADYCATEVTGKNVKPGLIKVEDTGNSVDTCAQQPGSGGGSGGFHYN
jgi:hypothetical protein